MQYKISLPAANYGVTPEELVKGFNETVAKNGFMPIYGLDESDRYIRIMRDNGTNDLESLLPGEKLEVVGKVVSLSVDDQRVIITFEPDDSIRPLFDRKMFAVEPKVNKMNGKVTVPHFGNINRNSLGTLNIDL